MTKTRLLRTLFLCPLFMLMMQYSWGQTKAVSGKVVDDKGAPVVGATVLGKGSKAGVSTDADGSFKFNVPTAVTTLVISSVGFADKEVDITSTSMVQVSLVPTAGNLNDIVVVGYGSVRKKDVTGAVASIGAKDFTTGAITDPMQQIEGKVPGLSITQPGGDPNQTLLIRLRGQTSLSGTQTPLIVVDGVPLADPTQISNIPPGDIASYDVLKDASAAAIYGARGANGVIIINTKKASGGAVKVDYNGYGSTDNVSKYYPLLDASQWRAGTLKHFEDGGLSPDSAQTLLSQNDHGANTDWQKAITRTAYTQNHNIAVSGGSAHFNFRGSVSYLDNQGVVIGSDKQGYGLRLNGEGKALNDKLDIQFGIENTVYNRHYTDYQQLTYPLFNNPTEPVYAPGGGYNYFVDFSVANPVAHLNRELNVGKEYLNVLKGLIDYSIIPGLKIGSLTSVSHFNKQTDWFNPVYPVEGNFNGANQYNYNTNQVTADAHIYYNTTWGRNTLGISAVYEYNYFEDDNFDAIGQQYLVEQDQSFNLGAGNSAYNGIGSYKEESYIASYVGRATYNWDSKYYATATIRRDGSSKFGVNDRWGNFPSFDLAWVLTQEKFLHDVSWLSNLKLRAGYGVTGNSDGIGDYQTLSLLGSGARYYDPTSSNYPYPATYAPSQNANPNLKWETKQGRNVGLDFGLFNNRLTGDADYFNDITKNLLYTYSVPTPPFLYSSALANVGSMSNKGFELGLNYLVIKKADFNWNLSGQISFVRTKVVSLSGTYDGYKVSTTQIPGGYAEGRGLSSSPITFLQPGYAPYTFYLPQYEGVDANGNQLFNDGKGNKVPLGQAKFYYIDPSPKFNWGFNNTFTYKEWSLNFFFRGVVGQKIFNNTALNEDFINRLPSNNVFADALTNGITDAADASTRYLEKASYLRLDNLTLAYTFKKIKGIDLLKVYVSGNNLFVITPYSGLDPEIRNSGTGTNNEAYIDATYGGDGYYFRTRSFSVGVNLSLE